MVYPIPNNFLVAPRYAVESCKCALFNSVPSCHYIGRIQSDTITPASVKNATNAKFGTTPPIAIDVDAFFTPLVILRLKFEAEKVTFEVAWNASVPNCTDPRYVVLGISLWLTR